jgi:hypothetical protein
MLEWNQAHDQSRTPVARLLYTTIPHLPGWERWLESIARLSSKAEGAEVVYVKVPRLRLRPRDGKEFTQLVRSRLAKSVDTLVVLVDEIGLSDNTADSSLSFARDVAGANGQAHDVNVLVVLFVIRRQADKFLLRTSAPRGPRRYELDDFSVPDVQNLLLKALSPQRIECDPQVAGHVVRLTAGRPDITMALLLDTWEELPGIKTRTRLDVERAQVANEYIATVTPAEVDRAAHQGLETLARIDGTLADARELANSDADARQVLFVLGDLAASGEEAHTRDEWLNDVKRAIGASKRTEKAFGEVWDVLRRAHVVRPTTADRWRFRGRLLRLGLKRVAS